MAFHNSQRILLFVLMALGGTFPLAAQDMKSIAANDNRVAAGELRDDVLTLRLELRRGVWHPEGEDGEAIPVYAFGEAGKPLQAPGPLIRVPQGTTIDMSVQNTLIVPATLHGLHEYPGDSSDVVTVAPGATKRIRFEASAPGTYLYFAFTPDGDTGDDNRRVADALLHGAFVVDAPGVVADDRIFVVQQWNGSTRTSINGKSWPYTEKLTYPAGEPVRWRVINPTDTIHPMHLHGLHFTVDGVGDGESFQAYKGNSRPLVVTNAVEPYGTFEMSWTPRETGRWLFHCHRGSHMRIPIELDPAVIPIALDPADVMVAGDHTHAHDNPKYAGMGGMVMGITVTGPPTETPAHVWESARKLDLVLEARNESPHFYKLTLQGESGQEEHMNSALIGPPIVLQQGEPVEITVVNRLKEDTSIHWHGLEMESYYDGVAIWGGVGDKRAPLIKPGKSFAARIIPSKAGTFIYHSHWHHAAQLMGGVNGPLIVMPSGQDYDPTTDLAFLVSVGPEILFGEDLLLLNGIPNPETKQLKTGKKYRFRFINITLDESNLRVSLRDAGKPVQWRAIAKDAIDLPSSEATLRHADLQVSVGETFDFEYEAIGPQELTLEGFLPNDTRRVVQTLIFSESSR